MFTGIAGFLLSQDVSGDSMPSRYFDGTYDGTFWLCATEIPTQKSRPQFMPLFSRLILTLFGIAFATLFLFAALVWLVLYLVFASLRWLATGQKPQAVLLWQQIQNMRRGVQSGQMRGWSFRTTGGDVQSHESQRHSPQSAFKNVVVEDVVVREVHETRTLPKD